MMNNNGVLLNGNTSNHEGSNNNNNKSSHKNNNGGGSGSGGGSDAVSQPAANKKKRNLPGNPDPEGEIIALSPRTLMATNRFVCEICHKGFQREQNLQLHRRGHNLPWKLKQRTNKEAAKKKFYVCPEPTCVHHDPSRALGDLTGVKKHYSRKHGEKKWKCEKCSKRYAVQSDWKAHSKVCGTREYRCDCGTVFSRRDSFITHRAFCDALTREAARAIPQTSSSLSTLQHQQQQQGMGLNPFFTFQNHHGGHHQGLGGLQLKREEEEQDLPNHHPHFLPPPPPHQVGGEILPPWLVVSPPPPPPADLSPHALFINPNPNFLHHHHREEKVGGGGGVLSSLLSSPTSSSSAHMSATELLQKAAEMRVTMSSGSNRHKAITTTALFRLPHEHQADHMSAPDFDSTSLAPCSAASTGGSPLGLSTRDQIIIHGLASFMNNNNNNNNNSTPNHATTSTSCSSLLSTTNNTMMMNNNNGGFERSVTFEEAAYNRVAAAGQSPARLSRSRSRGSNDDGLTRDFLGLTAAFPPPPPPPPPHHHHNHGGDFIDMAGLHHHHHNHHHNQSPDAPWHT